MSWREVHAVEKWAGPGALPSELPAGWGAGRLHPYTGTPGLGLQAEQESREQCPGAVLAAFSTTRPEPSGFWGGCSTGEGWFGLSHAGRTAAVYPTGPLAPAAHYLFLASAAGVL